VSKITDMLTPAEMVEKNWRTQNDFDNFWAHCIDFIDWHEKQVKMDPGETLPLLNQLMCVAYCAATWEKWQEGYAHRLTMITKDIRLDECSREISALKKERAKLKAKLRKMEKRAQNAKKRTARSRTSTTNAA